MSYLTTRNDEIESILSNLMNPLQTQSSAQNSFPEVVKRPPITLIIPNKKSQQLGGGDDTTSGGMAGSYLSKYDQMEDGHMSSKTIKSQLTKEIRRKAREERDDMRENILLDELKALKRQRDGKSPSTATSHTPSSDPSNDGDGDGDGEDDDEGGKASRLRKALRTAAEGNHLKAPSARQQEISRLQEIKEQNRQKKKAKAKRKRAQDTGGERHMDASDAPQTSNTTKADKIQERDHKSPRKGSITTTSSHDIVQLPPIDTHHTSVSKKHSGTSTKRSKEPEIEFDIVE